MEVQCDDDRVLALIDRVQAAAPAVSSRVDGPTAGGYWFIDFALANRLVVVEFRPGVGYGVSVEPHEPFVGPDIVCDLDAAVARTLKGLLAGS